MASWIVHLRIAEKLLATIPGLSANDFIVGSVAPDSGIPDEKWENFDPPPEVTHFIHDRKLRFPHADLIFYRKYLQPVDSEDQEVFSFLLGYFFHLVTDNLWRDRVGRPARARFAEKYAADPDFIWEVKRDWYGLDFIYLRDYPTSPVWTLFKGCRYARQDLDFLPASVINERLEYIRTYYQRDDDEVRALYERPFIYLSAAEMDRFVEETTNVLIAVHQQVIQGFGGVQDAWSCLDLVESVHNVNATALKAGLA